MPSTPTNTPVVMAAALTIALLPVSGNELAETDVLFELLTQVVLDLQVE